jgi:hypothetical protein
LQAERAAPEKNRDERRGCRQSDSPGRTCRHRHGARDRNQSQTAGLA